MRFRGFFILFALALFLAGVPFRQASADDGGSGCGGWVCRAKSAAKWVVKYHPLRQLAAIGYANLQTGMEALDWVRGNVAWGYNEYVNWATQGMGRLSPEEALALDLGRGLYTEIMSEGAMAVVTGAAGKVAQLGAKGARGLYGLSDYAKFNREIAAARAFRVPGADPTTIAEGAVQLSTDVFGRGSGGTVYRGTMKGEEVAVKIITDHYNPRGLTPEGFASAEEYTRRQAGAFEILSKNNIGNVRYHGTVNVGGRTGMVTNAVENIGSYGTPYKAIPGEWVLSAEETVRFEPKVREVARRVQELGYVFSDTEYAILKGGDIAIMDPMLVPISKAFVPAGMSPWEYSMRQMVFVRPTGFIQ